MLLPWIVAPALAASPCVATASGPGWRATLTADAAGGAITHARQEVVLDVPAPPPENKAYAYDGKAGMAPDPRARIVITELVTPGQPSAGTVELMAPELYVPDDTLLAGLTGEATPPLAAGIRVVAGGKPIAWRSAAVYPAPPDLPGTALHTYSATFGDLSEPPDPTWMEPPGRIMDALVKDGITVETVVPRKGADGAQPPLGAQDDPTATEVAGRFTISAAAILPALQGLATLPAQAGEAYATGKCGTPPAP